MSPFIKHKCKIAILGTYLCSFSGYAIEEWTTQHQSLHFGSVIPVIGHCVLDENTSVVTSPSSICLGPGSRGHYKIHGDANQLIKVTLNNVVDVATGINFNPVGRLVNNLGDDISAPIAGVETWIRIGSDGIIDIYVGGTLNLNQRTETSTPYILQYDIDYEEA